MEVWLLNHLSTLGLAILMIGGVFVFAALGSMMTRRKFPQVVKGTNNDMVGVLLGMYGAIYGIILAFVVVAEWEGIGVAENIVANEATHAAEIVRGAAAFPEPVEKRLIASVGDYTHAVVEVQWPLMRAGKSDSRATESALQGIYQVLQSYEPVTESEKTYYAQAVAHLDDVVSDRRDRITASTSELPILLKVLVYGGALVMVPLTFLYGIPNRKAQLMFVGSVAALIGVSLLLTLSLDRPFAGDLAVPPTPFKEGALAQFWQ
ncbi:DUF4239 domain-containing protein [Streptomyces sp. NBC_00237]|uniref:bestrophin-like domain n=1 Tax=Streptomyces sp. NBC_00237 TaxID=2975687 RepID=UPI00225AD1A1|nr:DUF4239 domain-containing protein [Streptomyces sp. NBC_00237]MCX5202834.1 DUF4239 domain-containing protein [Streptomyces sp. NBC_00237]